MFRLLFYFCKIARLLARFPNTFCFSFQHFIASDVMEDGQVAGIFAPERTEEDPEDLEYHGLLSSSDSGSEDGSSDNTADAGAADNAADVGATDVGTADQGGTRDPSFGCFLNEWSDDECTSKFGDSGADSHPEPQKAPLKHS